MRAGTSRKSERIDHKNPKFIGPKQNPVLKETRADTLVEGFAIFRIMYPIL